MPVSKPIGHGMGYSIYIQICSMRGKETEVVGLYGGQL
jgi:hypothetical protein